MLKMFWKSLLVSPAILGATLVASARQIYQCFYRI